MRAINYTLYTIVGNQILLELYASASFTFSPVGYRFLYSLFLLVVVHPGDITPTQHLELVTLPRGST